MLKLNEEQLRAVAHPLGRPACLIAGAGSGKTSTITERVRWLMTEKVLPFRICCITFTNKAAQEIKNRLNIPFEPDFHREQTEPHVSTIHSLALNAIRKNPEGFGFTGKVTPMDDYDQSQMIKKLIERSAPEPGVEKNPYRFLEKLGYHRARGVGFAVDYTDEVHEDALERHGGYHALEDWEKTIWAQFETEKNKCGSVDFDDMIHLVVRRGESQDDWRAALQRRFHHVLQDESQDTSPIQWRFVNLLLGDDNPNLYCVGDLAQCQPPGTKVKVTQSPPIGSRKAICKEWNIEDLNDGFLVPFWRQDDQRTYCSGKPIKVASRFYIGDLIKIKTGIGSTEVTPSHWNWVRFNKNVRGKYLVYLMYRHDLGFRVGTSVFKRSTAQTGERGAYGLSYRMNQEKAEAGWILRICDFKAEAEAWEEIYSVRYGIPESLFESGPCRSKSDELIRLVFSHVNPQGGRACLAALGLLESHPIITNQRHGRGNSWRGFFKTAAVNIFPEYMDIPIEGRNKSTPILGISKRHYQGLVYSLEVEQHHTYIADGLVVGNSIYAFQGAEPRLLKEYSEGWRGFVPDLYKISRNHRSLPNIIRLSNKINATMTEVIPLKMQTFRGVLPDGKETETGATRLIRSSTPGDVAVIIAQEIKHDSQLKGIGNIAYKDNAILVRSAMQVRDLEGALVRFRIPYVVRGGKGLLQTEEIKDILSYFRLAVNNKDFTAFVRAAAVPKRGVGDVAMERIRKKADQEEEGDLVAACEGDKKLELFVYGMKTVIGRLGTPAAAMEEIVTSFNYKDYINAKYHKEPGKARTKCENIDRFLLLINNLVSDGLSAEDLVFQLALEHPTDNDEETGKVTISTIHSAKGLEWKKVFLTNCTEGSIPHRFSMGSETEIEEERRLLYVACTRARDQLAICVHGLEPRGPNTVSVAPSRFLKELNIVS
jgi:superfamily I DNA/RNA helicase